jgi:hypothetical protein
VRFNLLFPDGRKLTGEITFPGSPAISTPARRLIAGHLEAGLKQMKDHQHAKLVRPLLSSVIPGIAAQLEPHLPPAAPAIRKVQTIEDPDRGTATTSTTQRPAVPPPAISARQIAAQLAPYVVAERLVAEIAKRQVVHAAAVPVAAAVAQRLTARLDQVEGALAESDQSRLKGAAQ